MKYLLLVALLVIVVSAKADPYFQHASLAPSNIQGEVVIGAMKTNAGYGQETILPLFYRNAAASDPWYKPSFAPLACGWSAGGQSVSGGCGMMVDVGPQLVMLIEEAAGLFSGGKASATGFFNCGASSTACAAISTGVIGNLNIEDSGKLSTTWKELGAHPLGYFLGPSVKFGGNGGAVVGVKSK
jgi:hypothetical protein